jgi:hypothetical protein
VQFVKIPGAAIMDYERIDLISLFDVEFHGDRVSSANLEKLRNESSHKNLQDLFAESRNWIFGREPISGLQRFCFPPSKVLEHSKGSSLLVCPEHGAGVFSVWQTITDGTDPLELKRTTWESGTPFRELTRLNLDIVENDREYPFIAVRARTSDLTAFCKDNAMHLGQVFTGNYENEEIRYLENYVSDANNISRRNYERVFVRWTDALAVYGNSVDELQYEQTLFRAVQLFENCILLRRLLDNIDNRVQKVSSTLSFYRPRPWAVQKALQSVREFQREFVDAPPIWSLEASRLLTTTYSCFGIKERFEATNRGCDLMEKRFQWAKTQLFVSIGVLTYLLDKLKLFDLIAKALHLSS